MDAAAPVIPKLDNTFGALLVGIIVAAFLEGVLTLQCYVYFTTFKNDRVYLKYLVFAVWVLDFIHFVVICRMQYHYVITNFGNLEALGVAHWTFDVAVLLTSVIAFIIQMYFVWRAWIFTKAPVLAAFIFLLSLLCLGTGLACSAETFLLVDFAKFIKYRWLVGLWLGSSAACDVLVAGSLCYTLWNSRTGFRTTDGILTRLIVWTLNTGLLTSAIAIVDTVCFTTMDNLIHFAFNVTLGKLYANMFVATLNQRTRSRAYDNTTNSANFGNTWHGRDRFNQQSGVQITTVKETISSPPILEEEAKYAMRLQTLSPENKTPARTVNLPTSESNDDDTKSVRTAYGDGKPAGIPPFLDNGDYC
ncbi:hypothetical protein SISNIDRAFT_496008 [Sistotremastrum niveocremeum HHB9708]|uniref:DUF6534 domain-containing protein n=1 Tax=Sistotremastrum niveocremeum HHB9708 TaxID=1314777 RepID=A0A164TGK4_9AGAM|nr:hypothetical protein SISNIDRAFT_496008 [Sistotremastrum niveocremeum HHB9708]